MHKRFLQHNKNGVLQSFVVALVLLTQAMLAMHYPVHIIEEASPAAVAFLPQAQQDAANHQKDNSQKSGPDHICPICFVGSMLMKSVMAPPPVLVLATLRWERLADIDKAFTLQAAVRLFDAQGPPARA